MDPIGGSPWAPQTLNRYSYVWNNPMGYSDPFGLEAVDACGPGSGGSTICGGSIGVTSRRPTYYDDFWVSRPDLLGSVRGYYQQRFENAAVNGHYLAATIDYVGLELFIPETWEEAAFDLAMTAIFAGTGRYLYKAYKAKKIAGIVPVCFPAGTLVWTVDGLLAIEEVEPGQLVACANPITEEWSLCEVGDRLEHDFEGTIVTLVVEGDLIHATGDHPIWVVDGEELSQRPLATDAGDDRWPEVGHGRWVDAKDIKTMDEVFLTDGRKVTVTATSAFSASMQVFNLDVFGHHTYAVGSSGILVHNRAAVRKAIEKAESEIWQALKSFQGKTKTNGLVGKKRRYYEWDYTHGDIEVYNSKFKHMGSMDALSGKMYKPAVPGRGISL